MLGILLGVDDGLLEVIPGANPERGITGPRITSIDYRDGLGIAGAPDAGVWVHTGGKWWPRWEGDARCVRVSPDGALFVGTDPPGVLRSDDRGETWTEIAGVENVVKLNRTSTPTGHKRPFTTAIAFPREGLLLGIAGAGAWHTRDDGKQWLRRSEGLDPKLNTLREHPELRDRIFASTESGFYRSEDEGFSWLQALGGLDRSWGGDTAIMPGAPDALVMAAARHAPGEDGALFRSPNGGVTWKRVMLGGEDEWERIPVVTRLWDTEDTLFAAAGHEVWASHDSGRNWTLLADGLPVANAIAAAL